MEHVFSIKIDGTEKPLTKKIAREYFANVKLNQMPIVR